MCFLFWRWESLLLDFHSWKKKITSCCPRIWWHDVKEEWNKDWLYPRSSSGIGSPGRFLLPGWVSGGLHRHQQGGTQDTSGQALIWGRATLAPPLCFSLHPYLPPSISIVCAWGCKTDGNQFRGKWGKAENSTKRWPVSRITVLCCLLELLSSVEDAYMMFFIAQFSFFLKIFCKVMFFQTILSGVEFEVCSFWTYRKVECFSLANDYFFEKQTSFFFFFFWIQLSPSEATSD